MLCIAGKAAEEFFNCPEDPPSLHDLGEIARARIILEEHREQALRLVACLVEHGHVNEPEFLRLMSGE